MKFVTTMTVMATMAIAMPTQTENNNSQHSGGDCSITGNNSGSVHCCESGGILSGLFCNVLAIGETCDVGQHVYCCNNQSGGLINLNLLNCVNL
ncbi:hypothetical protein VHEMI03207 [[Torrubiella] hemipterigena]|uniref:Hydrophobin n=1 Tax=[Torrubiella] hemipterigena TaxID=1531966 RepID=A0A0A1SXY5_9HYPO|nr:hypothetical protein VHEMI03207 [[Torrubiella] hemipterigena]